MRNMNNHVQLMWSAECSNGLFFDVQTRFACRSVSYYSVSKIKFTRFTQVDVVEYTKGLRGRFLRERRIRTTMRNAQEGDVWKTGQS